MTDAEREYLISYLIGYLLVDAWKPWISPKECCNPESLCGHHAFYRGVRRRVGCGESVSSVSPFQKPPTPSASTPPARTKLDWMRNKRRMGRFGENVHSLCGQSLSSIGTTLRGTRPRDNHTIAKTAWTRFAAADGDDRFEDFQPTIEHVHLRHR